jgi:hypothetical protein
MNIQIVLPERSEDALSEALRELTGIIDPEGGYGLGGPDGYGANFENEVFMMHRFCWCESESCPWCMGCMCEASEKTGMIRHYGDDGKLAGGECGYCHGTRHVDKGAEPGMGAPNFWHKPSGLKVWWYKWIGRGMEVRGPEGADLIRIIDECKASYRASEPPKGAEG